MYIHEKVRLFCLISQVRKKLTSLEGLTYLGDEDIYMLFQTPKGLGKVTLMNCTSVTEYCTEVHVVHPLERDDFAQETKIMWREILEDLRKFYNKDWIINDSDLQLSILR